MAFGFTAYCILQQAQLPRCCLDNGILMWLQLLICKARDIRPVGIRYLQIINRKEQIFRLLWWGCNLSQRSYCADLIDALAGTCAIPLLFGKQLVPWLESNCNS